MNGKNLPYTSTNAELAGLVCAIATKLEGDTSFSPIAAQRR